MRAKEVVPARGRAFNLKGFRLGLTEQKITAVFSTLLPGCLLDLWELEPSGKIVGRVYVSSEIESVYPEFTACAENPGKDLSIAIGPFELFIWVRCLKKKKRKKIKKAAPAKKRSDLSNTLSVCFDNLIVFSWYSGYPSYDALSGCSKETTS